MLKIAQIEKKDWVGELYKFLLAYRSTPQTSTGATPVRLMQGREIRSKLPELRSEKDIQYEAIRDSDWEKKISGKIYADSKRGARDSLITTGAEVFLKNTKETGKLAPNFEKEPYTVKSKEGNELTVVSKEGVEYKRNSSFVKPVESDDKNTNQDNTKDSKILLSPRKEISPSPRRTARTTKLPEKFKDFVLEDKKNG